MRFLAIVLCFVGYVYANSDELATVLRSDFKQSPDGTFNWLYETDNGISGQAEGHLKVFNKDEVALEVSGTNQHIAPDGEVYQVSYVANENGYQPQGAHLPTTPEAPTIPPYIARALEYIAAHPYVEKKP